MPRKPKPVPTAPIPTPPAGKGEESDAPLTQHGDSETMALIRRAVRNRWIIPARVYEAAPAIVGRILVDPATDAREKIRAAQTLAMLDRNNADLLIEANRIERLNEGMSTENVALVARITDEQIAAVASTILPVRRRKA